METKNVNTEEIEFDLTKALIIIEKDGDLNEMLRSKYGTEYKVMHALINSGTGIKKAAEAYIKALFDGVILEKKELRNKYLSLKGDETVTDALNETVSDAVDNTPKKKVANKMRWGLKAIASDIVENFKGKGTQLHSCAKKVQELKKIFIRLEQRNWKERFKSETLSDAQLREIGGAIETFNKKIESIVNPKK